MLNARFEGNPRMLNTLLGMLHINFVCVNCDKKYKILPLNDMLPLNHRASIACFYEFVNWPGQSGTCPSDETINSTILVFPECPQNKGKIFDNARRACISILVFSHKCQFAVNLWLN